MRERLFKLLGVEHGEESMVSMLLTQSVFLGIFFGAFDISAHSLFLSIFDEKMMARGYVVSGLAGIILTSLYTWMQTRMAFRSFAVSNLLFVTVLTLILWLLLLLNPTNLIVFIVFIMLGPLNILAMLGFWGTTARLFTLRQGKRLFSLVDVGLIIGIIVSCYAIPVLLAVGFNARNILLISSGSLLIASIMQILIGSKFKLSATKETNSNEEKKEKKSLFTVFSNDKYVRIIAVFIALSVMTAFFVQYSFMAVTREQYPSEEDMARFLGLFTGSMMIFTLLVKLLVFSYLIRNYGLKICLALSPVLVAAFTLIAVLLGSLMGYNYGTGGFMLFFMLLALSRLFSKALKDSIESPSFKVLYQTLDEKIRYEVQSGMDGTVNEISALTSGLLLAGLGILSFIKLIHFSWVLFALTLLWVLVALRLYAGYRKSIRNALEAGGNVMPSAETTASTSQSQSRFSAGMNFRDDYFSLVSGNMSVLSNRSNNYYDKIISFSYSTKDINLLQAVKKIGDDGLAGAEIRASSIRIAESLAILEANDSETEDKLLSARKNLAGMRLPQTTLILRLLRDNSVEAKRLAINMIGKFRMTDLLPEVCECLNVPGLRENSEAILKSFGDEASSVLQRYYLASSGNIETSKSILKLLSNSSGRGNEAFILSRLWSNSRQVKETALKYLINNYHASDEERDRLHQYISDVIAIITWIIAARVTISKIKDDILLQAVNSEINRWNAFLFNLLGITYDSGSVARIRENLERGTVESVNYALEMIDIVVDDSIKPKLVPLLDIIPDEEKLKSLYHFYPGEIPDHQHLIENIINRDYNLLGIWIRVCALRNIGEIKTPGLAESVSALLFSPEEILFEEASLLISRTDPSLLRSVSSRLPAAQRQKLEKIIGKNLHEELLWNKVKFLSGILPVNEEFLICLACKLKFSATGKVSGPVIDEENIVWPSGSNTYTLSLDSVEEFVRQYPDHSKEVIRYIENIEK